LTKSLAVDPRGAHDGLSADARQGPENELEVVISLRKKQAAGETARVAAAAAQGAATQAPRWRE
jgi:hypothetical protein